MYLFKLFLLYFLSCDLFQQSNLIQQPVNYSIFLQNPPPTLILHNSSSIYDTCVQKCLMASYCLQNTILSWFIYRTQLNLSCFLPAMICKGQSRWFSQIFLLMLFCLEYFYSSTLPPNLTNRPMSIKTDTSFHVSQSYLVFSSIFPQYFLNNSYTVRFVDI